MKLRRTMKAQNPKKKKKEINNNNNKEKRRGSQSSQRTCSKDLGQARGYAVRRINIKALCMFRPTQRPLKIQQNPGIIFVTHSPSPWDPEWIVRKEWFGR